MSSVGSIDLINRLKAMSGGNSSIYNFQHMSYGTDKGHGRSIIERNQRFPGMTALGFNAEYMYIHTAQDLRKIIKYLSTALEDGKQGAYVHTGMKTVLEDPLTRRTKYKIKKTPTVCHGWNMHNNSQFYCIETHDSFLKLRKLESHIKKWDMRGDRKAQVLETLKEVEKFMVEIEDIQIKQYGIVASTDYNGYSQWGNSLGAIKVTVGQYVHVSCKGCGRPHSEHVVTRSCHHVCPHCGMQFPKSNIQMVAQMRTNDEGQQCGFHHADPSCEPGEMWANVKKGNRNIMAWVNQDYKKKAEVKIKTLIGHICDKLNIDGGDGESYIRKWAWKKYELYAKWLFKQGRWDDKKNKMGQWQLAAAFVWYSILSLEARTYCSSKWSLNKICEAAAELQKYDAYTPNYSRKAAAINKKRKAEGLKPVSARQTRALRLDTVHRYAEEISKEFPNFKTMFGIEVPELCSIDVQRGAEETLKATTDEYVDLIGKLSVDVPLPRDSSWDTDIVLNDKGYIMAEPDMPGTGYSCGLRKGDIIRSIDGIKCPKTVEETFDIIIKTKSKRPKTEGEKLKPIMITVLR